MGTSVRVLFVGSSEIYSRDVCKSLDSEADRFEIDSVADTAAALEFLSERPAGIDCLVTGDDPDGVDGLAVLEAVREEYPDLPVVLYVSPDSEVEAGDAITAGADEYVRQGEGSQDEVLATRIQNVVAATGTDERATERHAKQTIQRVTDAVVTVDADWRFTMVDERAAAIYDMTEEELLGMHFWDVFEGGLGTQFETEYRHVMETREPRTFTAHYDGSDDASGLVGWFEIHVYPEPDGGLAFYFRDVTEREERKRELERYERIIEDLPVGVFRMTIDGTHTDVNPAYVDLVDGESKAEVLGFDAADLNSDDESKRDLIETLEREGEIRDREVTMTTMTGEEVVITTTQTLTEVDGNRYIEGIAQDITEHKQRERQLRHERERYRNLVENSPAPINLFDADGTAVWGNDALLELLGLADLSDLEGRSVFDFIHPDDYGIAEEEIERVIEDGETVGPTTFRIVRDDGEIRHVQVNTTAGWYEGERVGQAVVVDVTDLRETEQELRENEQRYRTLVEMSPDPIIVHTDGEIVYANEAMVDLVDGDDHRQLHGTHINQYLDPGEHADAERTARQTQRGETLPTRYERTIVTRAGERRHIETTSRPIAYEGTAAVLTVIKDVTDRYRYEQMLTTLHDRTRAMARADDSAAIADVAVGTTEELLGLDATLVYEFDGDDRLVPTSWSPETGDSPATAPGPSGDDSRLWDVFVTGEACFCTDWDDEVQPHPDVAFDSGLVLPVGNHGVLVTGAADDVTLSTMQREIAHLIAENLAAALDRAGRESELRARDEQLQRKNTALEQLNRLNGVIREINQTLIRSANRADIGESVCERLAATEQYAFAWLGQRGDDGHITPVHWSGVHPEYVDQLAAAEAAAPLYDLVETAFREQSMQVTQGILDDAAWEPHRTEVLQQGYRAVAAVPVATGTRADSVLVIHAANEDIFDEREQAVLAELGETIGYALRNVERVDALETDERTEIDVTISDDRLFTNRLSVALDASLEFVGAIPDEGETYRMFLRFEDVGPDAVERQLLALETVDDVRPLAVEHAEPEHENGDGSVTNGTGTAGVRGDGTSGLYQVTVTEPQFVTALRANDAQLRSLTTADGTTALTAVLTGEVSVRTLVESLQHIYPTTELVARREDPDPVDTRETFRDRIVDQLTEKQLDALQTAQYGGFYEWPRAATSEELAETRGISAPTFQYHLRAAERKVVSALLGPF